MAQMKTDQVVRMLKAGTLDAKTFVSDSAQGSFRAVATFPEFDAAARARLTAAKTESRDQDLRKKFTALDKADKRRKRWRWLRNLIDKIKGATSLIIWLAVIAAALAGAWWVYNAYLADMLNEMMGNPPKAK